MEKYYISTAIAYASGKPHIGNIYEVVLADSIARYKRKKGYDVYFQTGTDEHGEKVYNIAKEKKIDTQTYVDNISKGVRETFDLLNVSYDKFVRTSDPIHKKRVENVFNKLYQNGDIYLGKYEGWYCIPCEAYFTDLQLVDGKCPDCNREVQKHSEEAYFFKLSKYTDKLMKHINENPNFLLPEFRTKEIINNFILPGLQDLCITRESFDWGVKVPFDKDKVIYVWVDALINYITFIGYDVEEKEESFYKYWPADLQIVGKDIFRFHALYWPIILLALGEDLPKTIFGHQWLITDKEKMSKSKGNVLYAEDLVEEFGLDQIRYYILSAMPINSDGIISRELIIEKTNSELVNTLGNLVNRTIAMALKYFDGMVKKPTSKNAEDDKFIENIESLSKKANNYIEDINISSSLSTIIDIARLSNKYIDDNAPWTLAKENNTERLEAVIYNILESIRFISILLEPFIPSASTNILKSLNTKENSYDSIEFFGKLDEYNIIEKSDILFVRIEKE